MGVLSVEIAAALWGSDLRKTAIARRSSSERYCVLLKTTSAIGPITEARGETPVFRRSTTWATSQSATLASRGDVSDGAYQPCIGMSPPESSRFSRVAPNTLRGLWHATQWP